MHLAAAAKTPGVVAGNDLQVAEQTAAADSAQLEAASNNVQGAREALRSVTQLESYLEIRAPFDGVVTQRNLHPGALVRARVRAGGRTANRPNRKRQSLARSRSGAGSIRRRRSRRAAGYFQRAGISGTHIPRSDCAHLARHQTKDADDAGRTRFPQRGCASHAGYICKCRLADPSFLCNVVRALLCGDNGSATNIRDSCAPRKGGVG